MCQASEASENGGPLYPLPSTENIKTKCDGARLIPSRFAEGLIAAQIPTIVCSGEVQVVVILPPSRALLTSTPPAKTGITLRTNSYSITHRNTISNR